MTKKTQKNLHLQQEKNITHLLSNLLVIQFEENVSEVWLMWICLYDGDLVSRVFLNLTIALQIHSIDRHSIFLYDMTAE